MNLSVNIANSQKQIITTDNGKKYELPSKEDSIIGGVAGYCVGKGVADKVSMLFNTPLSNSAEEIQKLDQTVFKKAADCVLINSRLNEKGVSIVDAGKDKEFMDRYFASCNKNWLKRFLSQKRLAFKQATIDGKCAFFAPGLNKVVTNIEKRSISLLHEIGHSLNYTNGGFTRFLLKNRSNAKKIGAIVLLTALIKRKKADGEQPKGWFDKTTTFVKNNSGKLAFLSFVPILLEEGLASINANNLAKSVLCPKDLKLLNKHNFKCWLTYLGSAVALSAFAYSATKIRDFIAKPKEVKE